MSQQQPPPATAPRSWRALLRSRRARLFGILLVATGAISILAVQAAGSSLSYYSTPGEVRQHIAQQTDSSGTRWRVGGRVVPGTIEERNGRAVAFDIADDDGQALAVSYDGIVPSLFGPGSFVVVEGTVEGSNHIRASSVIIKHENEFVTTEPEPPVTE